MTTYCNQKAQIKFYEISKLGAAIAQSVQRLATRWKTGGSELEWVQNQEFSLLHSVQTSSGAHSACYPNDVVLN
jgi:hypothetical protein